MDVTQWIFGPPGIRQGDETATWLAIFGRFRLIDISMGQLDSPEHKLNWICGIDVRLDLQEPNILLVRVQ